MQNRFVPISKYTYCITGTHSTSYTSQFSHYLCGGAGKWIWICCDSTGLPLSLLPFFPEPPALRPFFAAGDDFGGGPEGGGGGNQGASATSRGLGQPCFCLISGEAEDGVAMLG